LTSAEPGAQLLAAPVAERVWRREFAVAADTTSATRRWLRSSLSEHVVSERLDTAMLLVEEIVASSVRRTLANKSITVLLALEAQLLRVDVIEAEHDSRTATGADIGGPIRGLMMVARNARSWGTTLGPPARVWFEI
jgi:hypothetical protein